jgi:hypothetical protein
VAGEQTGTVIVVTEADDFASAGASMDKAFADPEIQRFMSLGRQSHSQLPGLPVDRDTALRLTRKGARTMVVVTTTILQVKPDRFQEWLDMTRKIKPMMEKAGAKNIRVLVGLLAGQQTGTVVFTSEAHDFAGAGSMLDQAFADPEIQKILALGEGSPIAGSESSQFIDVPL